METLDSPIQTNFEAQVVDVLLEKYSCIQPCYANVHSQRENSIKLFHYAVCRVIRPCETLGDSLDQYKFITNVSEDLIDALTGFRNEEEYYNEWVDKIRDHILETLHVGFIEMFWNIIKRHVEWTDVAYHASILSDVRDGKIFIKNWTPVVVAL